MKISPGFTIIEMTVVLVILGLLMGSLLIPMSAQMEQKRLDITRQRLETIRQTLLGFAITNNGEFPNPDKDRDGRSDSGSEDEEGYLPWVSLGIEDKYDAWGHPFRYRVVTDDFKIENANGQEVSSGNVVAIIFSCGKNGEANLKNDALDSNDLICSNPGRHPHKSYTQDRPLENFNGENFDDVLIWISKEELNGSLTAAGKEPI